MRRIGLRASFVLSALTALLLAALATSGQAAPPSPPATFQRGVALGLFSEDALFSYRDLLREIAALSATHVELVVAYYQRDGESTEITSHPRFTAPDAAVARAIRDAHAVGLKVLLFPILRLSEPKNGEWRGTLRPRDPAAWWRSYRQVLLRVARLAAREHVDVLSVGSELSTLDTDRAPWAELITEVRRVFPGPLTYSGNWDHYTKVALYDLVDLLGVCGYFSLTDAKAPPLPTVEVLTARWQALRTELLAFAARVGRPLLFTEVGYLSQVGATAWPWDEGADKPVDLEEQRRAYAAFAATWRPESAPASQLAGVYFWNWYGWGGSTSGGYTPRNKPAALEIRRYFRR